MIYFPISLALLDFFFFFAGVLWTAAICSGKYSIHTLNAHTFHWSKHAVRHQLHSSISQRPYAQKCIGLKVKKKHHILKRKMLFYSIALDIAADYFVVLLHTIFSNCFFFLICEAFLFLFFFAVDPKCLFSGVCFHKY